MLPATLGPMPTITEPIDFVVDKAYYYTRNSFVLLVNKDNTKAALAEWETEFTEEDRQTVPLDFQADNLIFLMCVVLWSWFQRDMRKMPVVSDYCKRAGQSRSRSEMITMFFEVFLRANGATDRVLSEWINLPDENREMWLLAHTIK